MVKREENFFNIWHSRTPLRISYSNISINHLIFKFEKIFTCSTIGFWQGHFMKSYQKQGKEESSPYAGNSRFVPFFCEKDSPGVVIRIRLRHFCLTLIFGVLNISYTPIHIWVCLQHNRNTQHISICA